MKEIAGSIIILAGSLILVAAAQFDIVVFCVLGAFMLLDGYFLVAASVFFPEWLRNMVGKSDVNSTNTSQTTT